MRIRGALAELWDPTEVEWDPSNGECFIGKKKHADVDFWRVKWMILTYVVNFEMFYPLVI